MEKLKEIPEDVKLSAADRKLLGKTVVYRVHRYSSPKLGKLFGRNKWPDWEYGCWVVQDDADDRTYCLETKNGATWRLAGKEDIEYYKGSRKARRIRVAETEALSAMELGHGEAKQSRVPVKVEPKAEGMGGEIAKAATEAVKEKK